MKDSTRRTILCAGMLLIPLFIVLSQCGCSIERFNKPPGWASAIITHGRFYGLDASIPSGGTGNSVVQVKLGWGSTTWTVLPVTTNQVYAPKISDTFSVGQSLSPFDTTIREYLQTGWEGQNNPTPAMQLFLPRLTTPNVTITTTNPVNKPTSP